MIEKTDYGLNFAIILFYTGGEVLLADIPTKSKINRNVNIRLIEAVSRSSGDETSRANWKSDGSFNFRRIYLTLIMENHVHE